MNGRWAMMAVPGILLVEAAGGPNFWEAGAKVGHTFSHTYSYSIARPGESALSFEHPDRLRNCDHGCSRIQEIRNLQKNRRSA